MTSRIACAVFLVCPLVFGCGGLYRIGARNLCNEAKLIRDEKFEQIRYACLAHEAWSAVKASCPGRAYSADYAEGFQAGFVDYLYAGECGEPPALPPKRYRHFHAESPKGLAALHDWYDGFRHGAAVAKESGQRQFVLVSIPPPGPAQSPPPPLPLTAAPAPATNEPTPSPLPAPRRMPAESPHDDKKGNNGEEERGTAESLPPRSESSAPDENIKPQGQSPEEGPELEGSATEQPAREEQS